jgi:hypothetical protein
MKITWRRALLGAGMGLGIVGCDVTEVVLAEPDPLVIAEIYVESGQGPHRATALVHSLLGSGTSTAIPNAEVRLFSGGTSVLLTESDDLTPCVIEADIELIEATCYVIDPILGDFGGPGSTIEARVGLPGGSTLEGRTVVPADFALRVPEQGVTTCLLQPEEVVEIQWTPSEGAWAYLGETQISGLAEVLAASGSEVELREDPLFLTGLSISAADTTLTFPSEFGVFDRIHLERDISVLLQTGLPTGTSARVTIAALDRNSVNWVRGGSFNPSGSIRVPSLFGDIGTGVIGSTVRVGFDVRTEAEDGLEACVTRNVLASDAG